MQNKNFEVYIDLGSSKIRAAAFSNDEINDNFFYESKYFNDYLQIESEIEKTISKLEEKTDEYLNEVNLMVDSPEILTIGISLSKNLDGSTLKKQNVKFLIQDAKQQILSNYQNYDIIHIIIKNYKIDHVDYTFFPTSINANLLSVDIIFICLPKKTTQYYKSLFSKFDVSINQIFCSSYTKSINYKNKLFTIENIAFIDIGFNKTSLTLYNRNKISFFHIIPVGGNHITKDISKILKINLIDSEKIKINFDNNDNFLSTKGLSLDLLQKIIFSRIEEILELCLKSIKLNENINVTDKFKFLLMGDGSKILDNQFKEKIIFSHKIDLLEETTQSICESGLNLSKGLNVQEVVMIAKKQTKEGFFEKLFHLFK